MPVAARRRRARRCARGRASSRSREIETWMRDPYAIYARTCPAGCERWSRSTPTPARRSRHHHPPRARPVPARLSATRCRPMRWRSCCDIGRAAFGAAAGAAGRARLLVAALRAHRRTGSSRTKRRGAPAPPIVAARSTAGLTLAGPAGAFDADRAWPTASIGSAPADSRIVDYKTGAVPEQGRTSAIGYAPQLAARRRRSPRPAVSPASPARRSPRLRIWKLSGGDPAGRVRDRSRCGRAAPARSTRRSPGSRAHHRPLRRSGDALSRRAAAAKWRRATATTRISRASRNG